MIRKQLTKYHTVDDFLSSLSTASNIVVISGAGISVSCGIPDFRSKHGIYNTIPFQEIGLPAPELLFDLKFFEMEPEPFYKYAHNLIPKDMNPSLSHQFIAHLESKNKLLRNYTQNFDGLEDAAGITRYIQSHGTIQTFKCLQCRKKVKLTEIRDDVEKGLVPYCECGGIMKPSIIFFGEMLDNSLLKSLQSDCQLCDLIIVMGTSLSVGGPVISFLNQISSKVPQILINLRQVNPPKSISNGFDLSLIGECDVVVSYLCQSLQWDLTKHHPPSSSSSSPSSTTSSSSSSSSSASSPSLSSQFSSTSSRSSDEIIEQTQVHDQIQPQALVAQDHSHDHTHPLLLHPLDLVLEATFDNSTKRKRRLPSYLVHDYGVYRDDDNSQDLTTSSRFLESNSSLYNSSQTLLQMKAIKKQKKDEKQSRKSIATTRATTSQPPPPSAEERGPYSHLCRELRELYNSSNGCHEMNLSRAERRVNMKQKLENRNQKQNVATCSQIFNGIEWKLLNKRVYKFHKTLSQGEDSATAPLLIINRDEANRRETI